MNFHHATPYVNILFVPVMFVNFLRWLTIPDFAVMCVDTIQMEFSATFLRKVCFYSYGQLVLYAAATAISAHVNITVCVQCHEL